MIEIEDGGRLDPAELETLFEGWLEPPKRAARQGLLDGSDVVVTARDGERLVGFLTAITDGSMHAMITLLEVSPPYRGRRIGSRLVQEALARLGRIMDVVVTTDPQTAPFYARLGFEEAFALRRRDLRYQADGGEGPEDGMRRG